MNYCLCDNVERHPVSECIVPGQSNDEIFQSDIRAIAEALGLGGHARAYSSHAVVHREILPAIGRVIREVNDWPAADFWHRDAILRALRGDCTCGDTFNPKCPEHGGNEHRP